MRRARDPVYTLIAAMHVLMAVIAFFVPDEPMLERLATGAAMLFVAFVAFLIGRPVQ